MIVTVDAEDRNYPVKRKCPHCGNAKAMLQPALGDFDEFQCRKCGTYRISGSELRVIELGGFAPALGQLIKVNGTVFLTQAGVPMR